VFLVEGYDGRYERTGLPHFKKVKKSVGTNEFSGRGRYRGVLGEKKRELISDAKCDGGNNISHAKARDGRSWVG